MCCPLIDLHRMATGPTGGCDLCSQKSHQEVVETDVSSPHLESPDPAGHSATSSLNRPASTAAHSCCRFSSLHTRPVPGTSPVGGAGLRSMALSLGDPLRLTKQVLACGRILRLCVYVRVWFFNVHADTYVCACGVYLWFRITS